MCLDPIFLLRLFSILACYLLGFIFDIVFQVGKAGGDKWKSMSDAVSIFNG